MGVKDANGDDISMNSGVVRCIASDGNRCVHGIG